MLGVTAGGANGGGVEMDQQSVEGRGERRVMKWRRERGNVDGRRGRNDRIKETGESHVL